MPGISRVYWNDRGAFPVSEEVFSSHIVWKCLFHSTCCFDFWIRDDKCFAKAPDPSFLFCFPGTWGSATVSKALRYKYPRTNVLWAAPSVPLIRQCRHKGSRGLGVFFVTASFLPLQPRWATLRPSFTTRVSTSRPTLSGKYRHYSRVCNGEVGRLFLFLPIFTDILNPNIYGWAPQRKPKPSSSAFLDFSLWQFELLLSRAVSLSLRLMKKSMGNWIHGETVKPLLDPP